MERDRVGTTTRRDGSLVINERDAAKYSNARVPAIAPMETMRRTGRLISRADFLDDINCAASREKERDGEKLAAPTKRLPKRVGRVARETNWRSYRTESVESAAAAKFVLPDITPIRQIYLPSCPPYRTRS